MAMFGLRQFGGMCPSCSPTRSPARREETWNAYPELRASECSNSLESRHSFSIVMLVFSPNSETIIFVVFELDAMSCVVGPPCIRAVFWTGRGERLVFSQPSNADRPFLLRRFQRFESARAPTGAGKPRPARRTAISTIRQILRAVETGTLSHAKRYGDGSRMTRRSQQATTPPVYDPLLFGDLKVWCVFRAILHQDSAVYSLFLTFSALPHSD